MNDGGPAFPQPPCPDCGTHHAPEHVPGMSLRDYFAAASLTTLLDGRLWGFTEDHEVANRAYRIADAMLKAREEPQK